MTPRKFTVDYKTPDGWYEMKLRNGESKEARAIEKQAKRLGYMHKVVKSFLPPKAQIMKIVSVADKTLLEKAESVFEAVTERASNVLPRAAKSFLMPKTREFIDSRNMNGMVGSGITLWFGKEEEGSVSAMFYMFANDRWVPKRTLLEIQGEEKNAYIKREERLFRRVGEAIDIIGYFRVEGILPFPISVGESGTFYTYCNHQLIQAENFPELITQCIDLRELDRIEIDDGIRIIGKYIRKLECWYQHKYNSDTREVEYNYPVESFHELFEEL